MRLVLAAIVVALVGVPSFLMGWVRTPYQRRQGERVVQPVFFDHQIHVADLRIDCRYCHATVERAPSAGLPSTATCVPCHNRVWREGPLFAPVRRSLATGRSIPWVRVTRLPDFVFFNHAIHVAKGVGCETCHGRVDQMPRVRQTASLSMRWCLDCHRNPEPYLRPVDQVTTMGWRAPASRAALGRQLAARYHVQRLTNCSTCHR